MIYKKDEDDFKIDIEWDWKRSKFVLSLASDHPCFNVFSKDGIRVNFLGRIRTFKYEQEGNQKRKRILINAHDFLNYSPYEYIPLKYWLKPLDSSCGLSNIN